LLSGACGNGKDWKVGLVGDLDKGLRREPLGSLDGNINDITADVFEDRYGEEVGGRKSYLGPRVDLIIALAGIF